MNTMQPQASASVRTTVGAMLGTISTIANTISNSVNVLGDGVGMLNKYVSDAAEKQQITSDYDMALFEDNLVKQVTLTAAKQDMEIAKFFAGHQQNEAAFKTAHDRIIAAVNARRGFTETTDAE